MVNVLPMPVYKKPQKRMKVLTIGEYGSIKAGQETFRFDLFILCEKKRRKKNIKIAGFLLVSVVSGERVCHAT